MKNVSSDVRFEPSNANIYLICGNVASNVWVKVINVISTSVDNNIWESVWNEFRNEIQTQVKTKTQLESAYKVLESL